MTSPSERIAEIRELREAALLGANVVEAEAATRALQVRAPGLAHAVEQLGAAADKLMKYKGEHASDQCAEFGGCMCGYENAIQALEQALDTIPPIKEA